MRDEVKQLFLKKSNQFLTSHFISFNQDENKASIFKSLLLTIPRSPPPLSLAHSQPSSLPLPALYSPP
jgi:hypothetical protein